MISEIFKEIEEIINYYKENKYGWERKYSKARLKRLRLLANEIIKKYER